MSNTKFSIDKLRSFSDIMDDTITKLNTSKEYFNDPSYIDIDLKKLRGNKNRKFQHMEVDLTLFDQFIDICEDQILSPTHELNKLIENFIKERKKGNKRR